MNQELSHILAQSVCLSKRQVADYISGKLDREELHAVETHLLSCPLCAMAVEGFAESPAESLAALSSLNSNFLKEHFEKSLPQIHLNSVMSAAMPASSRKKGSGIPLFRTTAIAAGILLCIWGAWAIKQQIGRDEAAGPVIAKVYPAAASSSPDPENTARGQVASTATPPAASVSARDEIAQKQRGYEAMPAESKTALPARKAVAMKESRSTESAEAGGLGSAAGNSFESSSLDNVRPDEDDEAVPAAPGRAVVPEEAGGYDKRSRAKEEATSKKKSSGRATPAPASAPKNERSALTADEKLEQAKSSFDSGKYKDAIVKSEAAGKGGDPEVRGEASIVTARSYLKLGQKEKARMILLKLKEEKGATGRQARRLLRHIDD